MKNKSHESGPWVVSGPGSDGGFYAVRRQSTVRMGPHQSAKDARKTADSQNTRERVKDAAEDLLSTCEAVLHQLEHGEASESDNGDAKGDIEWCAKALRDAIANAKGGVA